MLLSLQNSSSRDDALSLIGAIRANPLANTPRLMFADWLDEHQDVEGCKEWAELIRLQCSDAATRPGYFFKGTGTQEEYLNTHRRIAELMPQVARLSGRDEDEPSERGFFVHREHFTQIDDGVFQNSMNAHPEWLFGLDLTGTSLHSQFPNHQPLTEEQMEALAAAQAQSGGVVDFEALGITPHQDAEIIHLLGACDSLRSLTCLSLARVCAPQPYRCAEALSQSENLNSLTTLELQENHFGAGGIRALAKWKGPAHLAKLNLSLNRLNVIAINALAQWEALTSVTSLDLSNNHIGAAGIAALARCQNLRNLVSLNLSSCELNNAEGIAALARCKNLETLVSLNLSHNVLDTHAITALEQCSNLRNLMTLDLSNCCNEFYDPTHAETIAPLCNRIATGILPNGLPGEALPSLRHVLTGNPELDQLFADAIAARHARLHPPQTDVSLAEIQQHSPANEVV